MQRFLIFIFVIGFAFVAYFGYINIISKSLKNQGEYQPTETDKILAEQSDDIKRLNQDYDSIMQDNRRQIEENRRKMEDLRRQLRY